MFRYEIPHARHMVLPYRHEYVEHMDWNSVTEQSFGTGSTSDEDSAMHRRCSERARALGAMKRQLVSPEVTRKLPGSYQEVTRRVPVSLLLRHCHAEEGGCLGGAPILLHTPLRVYELVEVDVA